MESLPIWSILYRLFIIIVVQVEGGIIVGTHFNRNILGGLILLLLSIGAPIKPLRFIGTTFAKLLIGALLLFFLNTLGNQFGIHVPINLTTSAVSGFLGIPGIFALVAIEMWII